MMKLPSISRRIGICIAAGAVLLLAYFYLVIIPRGLAYQQRLQALKPEEIEQITLTLEGANKAQCTLQSQAFREFLKLVENARPHSPHHPRVGWSCYVEIATKAATPTLSFLINNTDNDGTQIELNSNGRNGWNYGVLRNDALAAFVEKTFAEPR